MTDPSECPGCGQPLERDSIVRCDKCGWTPGPIDVDDPVVETKGKVDMPKVAPKKTKPAPVAEKAKKPEPKKKKK